jgi:hypothetical protein
MQAAVAIGPITHLVERASLCAALWSQSAGPANGGEWALGPIAGTAHRGHPGREPNESEAT